MARHLAFYSCFAIALGLAATPVAQAQTISYWNFNTLSIPTAGTPAALGITSIPATTGPGTVSLTNYLGNIDDFAGTTINAVGADPGEESLSLIAGGPAGGPFPGNGSSITFSTSTVGFSNIAFTFATQRSGTGFNSNQFAYSTDGTNFTDFGAPFTPPAAYAVQSFDLSSVPALNNVSNAFFRLTFGGATANAGNNRIDNVQIIATPEPGSVLALCAVAGVAYRLRRRFKPAAA